ncbi:MAG: hypothetical protein WD069_06685 [Planctomycetales bacterium]
MSIGVKCACGRGIRAKAALAGKRVRCPDCGAVVAIPADGAQERAAAPTPNPERREAAVVAGTGASLRSSPGHPAATPAAAARRPRVLLIVLLAGLALVVLSCPAALLLLKFVWPRLRDRFMDDLEDLEQARP